MSESTQPVQSSVEDNLIVTNSSDLPDACFEVKFSAKVNGHQKEQYLYVN